MRRALSRFVLPLGLALAGGCSGSEAPPKGQVMVSLSTDMSVPKDVSLVRVKVKLGAEVRWEYDFRIAPDGQFHIPGTIAVVEGSNPSPVVTVEVVGIRQQTTGVYEARTFGKAITTIPRERTALLEMPVQWLCDSSAVDDGSGEFLSTCAVNNDGAETACVAGSCEPVHIDPNTLPTFNPRAVYGGGASATDPAGRCFDTLTCFDAGYDLERADLDEDCTLRFEEDALPLNFALAFKGGGDGICHGTEQAPPCYVPLDEDERLGWRVSDESGGKRTVKLPKGACDALEDGRADAIRVTTSCESKTTKYPTCGEWSAVSEPSAPVNVGAGGTGGRGGSGGTSSDAGIGNAPAGGTSSAGEAGAGNEGGQINGGGGKADGGTPSDGGKPSVGGSMSGGGTPSDGGTGGGPPGKGGNDGKDGGSTGVAGATRGGNSGGPAGGDAGATGEGGASGGTGGTTGMGGTGAGGGPPIPAACVSEVTFTDPFLEGIVREVIAKPTGTLVGADVADIMTLSATGNGISDLGGIECLVGLHNLHLDSNSITDLTPLEGLTALTFLDVSSNLLTSLAPLATLTNLQTLQANGNTFADFDSFDPLQALPDLNVLHVNQCGITDISSLAGLTSLTDLVIWGNTISELSPLSGLVALESLDLSVNNISDVTPLSGLVNLSYLSLQVNYISDPSPLLENTGLGAGDTVDLNGNSICSSPGLAAVQSLRDQGVTVNYSGAC